MQTGACNVAVRSKKGGILQYAQLLRASRSRARFPALGKGTSFGQPAAAVQMLTRTGHARSGKGGEHFGSGF